ncbi:AMP-binding protein [Rheinheimera baltica]|nr:AMP-binding protein [Rheinheimera baltica]MDP5190913.1 AMP-binding protein [Rheinheimera baltica]
MYIIQSQFLAQQLHASLTANKHACAINQYQSGHVTGVSGTAVDTEARQLAAVFIDTHLAQSPVLVLLDGGLAFLSVLVAGIYAGTTIAPCPVPTKDQDYQRLSAIHNDTKFKWAIVHTSDEQKIAERLPNIEIVTVESLLAKANVLKPVTEFLQPVDDISIIQYSSGSTASPKGVLLTGKMILANFAKMRQSWKLGEQHRYLNWLPHYHDMGLFGGILYPILACGWIMMMASKDFISRPSIWLKLISQYRVNFSGGPPFAYELCLRYLNSKLKAELDLSCWTSAFCGADYIPASLKQHLVEGLSDAGFSESAFFACYGLAETVLFAGGERCIEGQDSCALPLLMKPKSDNTLPCYLGREHADIGIFSLKNNESLEDGLEGEICLTGDAVALNYTSGELPSFEYQQRRWIKTGDVGIIQNDFLTITGRLKDIIKLRGKTLYPFDFAVLANKICPQLNPHAIILQLAEGGDVLRFSIETYQNQSNLSHNEIAVALQLAFNDAFGVFVRDIDLYKRNTLPRTTSGKIQRWVKREE